MKRATLALCVGAAAGCATTPDVAPSPDRASASSASSPDAAVNASNRFGFDLYARVKRGRGNLICSPVSASIALNMTAAGSRGQTLLEMSNVLHLDRSRLHESHASFGSLLDRFDQIDGRHGVQLQVADRLWAQKELPFKRDFLTLLEERYRAPLAQVDFTHDAESARVAINHWAALRTHDRIPQFLPPGAIDASSRLVLINALYFKSRWLYPFEPDASADLPFSNPTRRLTARMMTRDADLAHAIVPGAALVELPYDGHLSMVVVLPDAVDGLDDVESRIATSYQDWLAALRHKRVDLKLPRWKVASNLPLSDALAAMGMPTAFSAAADFTGMADIKPLFIQKVIQQAFVDVDEIGTEAAGLTALIIEGGGRRRDLERVVFHADHPFMYLIRDKQTGAILFVGRMVEPGT